jgi:hypothetical protein
MRGVGILPRVKHPHESLVLVEFRKKIVQRVAGDVLLQIDISRGEHAARHRHQVRRKRNCKLASQKLAQLLLDLRRVAVFAQTVRGDRFVGFAKMRRLSEFAPGSRNTGFGIDDDGLRIRPVLLHERSQRQNCAGRVAPRIGHQLRFLYFVPMQFRQSVNRLLDDLRIEVRRLVPVAVYLRIVQSIISAEVDDFAIAFHQLRHVLH